MEELNRDLQRRVWERVQGKAPAQMPTLHHDNCRGLIYPARENAAVYQSLMGKLPGQAGEKLKKLFQEEQRCIACLKGICRLRGEQVKPAPVQPAKEPPQRALEKCYQREKKRCLEYESRTADPEYGVVFGRLAQQSREHCVMLLELLGDLA